MLCILLVIFASMWCLTRGFVATTINKIYCNGPKSALPFSFTKLYLTTTIYIVGKRTGGENWIQSGCAEYEKRLQPVMQLQTIFLKTDDDLLKACKTLRGSVFALDENGKQHSSIQFTNLLYEQGFREGGSHVSFIVGGFAGLPEQIRSAYPLISLSKMTWTHQMARLLLIEQVYRASEIMKGSSYHKE